MDFLDEETAQKQKKSKKGIAIVSGILVILIIIAIALYLYIVQLQAAKLKVVLNGVSQSAEADKYIILEDGTVLVSIKDFAKDAGYSYYNGEYKQYTEDTSKCNVISPFEVASFEVNNNEYYKVQLDKEGDSQYFESHKPVTQINNKLYAPEEMVEKAFNVAMQYEPRNNTIYVTTLDYLISNYISKYPTSALAGNSNEEFSIKKAALYNYVVTVNPETRLYGVSLLDTDGELDTIIGNKYSRIEFIETSQDFIVTTQENKKGLINKDGQTRIRPEYDYLKIIDNDYDIFLIKKDQNYGVINKSGKYIVYPEFNQIGIDKTLYPKNDIKNPYLLYDNCIPVKKDKKWGIIDRNGKVIANFEYDNIGCVTTTQREQSVNNILLVNEYEGIVVQKNKQYGLINSLGAELLPCVLQEVYSVTNSGKDTIYMNYQNQKIDLINYLQTNGIVKIDTVKKENVDNKNNNQNNNVNSNRTVNALNKDNTMVTNNANNATKTDKENKTEKTNPVQKTN